MGFVRRLTGKTAARKAGEAAEIQQVGIDKATEQLRQTFEQSQQTFQPFVQAGQAIIPQVQQLLGTPVQLGELPSVMPGDISQDSLFNALKRQAIQSIEGSAAARGRVGAGGTLAGIGQTVQDLALQRTGDIQRQNLLARQQLVAEALNQRQLQSQELLNQLSLGQQAALAQAGAQSGFGQTLADMITGRANVEAAALVGAENARTAGARNLLQTGLQIGSLISGAMAPSPAMGGAGAGAGGTGSLSPAMASQVSSNPLAFPNITGSGLNVGFMGAK